MKKITHISEELLGAYLEGTLTPDETKSIKSIIESDSQMSAFVEELTEDFIVLGTDGDRFQAADDSYVNDNLSLSDGLPDLDEETIIADTFALIDEELMYNDNIENVMSTNDELTAMRIFGQDGVGDIDQIYLEILQGTDSTCAVRSQQIILRDYGILVTEEQLANFAEKNGWYSPESGTPPQAMGLLLESCGIHCQRTAGNTIYDLTNELAQGHRVMVAVDSGELWAKTFGEKALEFFEDAIHGDTGADHALIVAGVEVNPHDANDVKVVLTDPGAGHLRVEYPLDKFMDAWADSNCLMVSTTEPAPYQYNPSTNAMEPSHFATEFVLNEFVQQNSFELPIEQFTDPKVFFAEGHLDTVNNVPYADFSYALASVNSAPKSEFAKAWDALKSLFDSHGEENHGLAKDVMGMEPESRKGFFDNDDDTHHHQDDDDDDDDDDDNDDDDDDVDDVDLASLTL